MVSIINIHIALILRKLQVSVATDLASKGSNSSNIIVKGETDDYLQSDTKVRCPCGSSLETESMIKVIYHLCITIIFVYLFFNMY